MPREKTPRTVNLKYPGGMIWVPPVNPANDIRTNRQRDGSRPNSVPAIEGAEADGRRHFLTMESSAGTVDRAGYARRLRLLAATLTKEADRLEDPDGR